MTKTLAIQRFEIYGNKVHMGQTDKIQLKKVGSKTYEDGDGWTWVRKGPMYIRGGGNEHGFMVLVHDDSEKN
jgi:hypothetical protein